MSRKTRKLIWPLPGMATFAIVAALAIWWRCRRHRAGAAGTVAITASWTALDQIATRNRRMRTTTSIHRSR